MSELILKVKFFKLQYSLDLNIFVHIETHFP